MGFNSAFKGLMNLLQETKKKKGKGVKGKVKRTKSCGWKETLTNYGTQ
jgi:hypothetical protein